MQESNQGSPRSHSYQLVERRYVLNVKYLLLKLLSSSRSKDLSEGIFLLFFQVRLYFSLLCIPHYLQMLINDVVDGNRIVFEDLIPKFGSHVLLAGLDAVLLS